jgi:hypothetical protein
VTLDDDNAKRQANSQSRGFAGQLKHIINSIC